MKSPSDVPIPARMAHLPLDPRGYPIFYVAWRGPDGKPAFTINDTRKNQRCMRDGVCPICGGQLYGAAWLCGGPRSAFDEHGVYNDPPMHRECLHYALQVCPYLAAPRYAGSIAEKQAKSGVFADTTMIRDRPDVFVCIRTRIKMVPDPAMPGNFFAHPRRPPTDIEYWKHGQQLSEAEGKAICDAALALPMPEIQPGKVFVKP